MADQRPVSAGHPDMDYAEHDATFALFVRLLKGVSIVVVCILLFLACMWG